MESARCARAACRPRSSTFPIPFPCHVHSYLPSQELLQRDKVPKHIPNFENESYMHCSAFIREDMCGTLSYFLLDVEKPSPRLLLDDPDGYESELKSAGGIACFQVPFCPATCALS